jgi:hypothetical protein
MQLYAPLPLQALMLMYQLLAGRNAVSERYYRALYAVLLTEGATGAAGEPGSCQQRQHVLSCKGMSAWTPGGALHHVKAG